MKNALYFASSIRKDSRFHSLTDAEFRVWLNLKMWATDRGDFNCVVIDRAYVSSIEVANGSEDLLEQCLCSLAQIGLITRCGQTVLFTDNLTADSNPMVTPGRKEWEAIRPKVAPYIIKRDGGKCAYCGTSKNLTIDHIVPIARGGKHGNDNLVTACRRCNSSKNAKTPQEWRSYH